MINRIEIISKLKDARALVQKARLESLGYKSIEDVNLADIYTLDKNLNRVQLEKIASILTNPTTQESFINKVPVIQKFDWALEIGFLPGVTDNVAATVKDLIRDLYKIRFSQSDGVYSSQLIFITGILSRNDIENIKNCLINPIIQRAHIKSNSEYNKDRGMDKIVPSVRLQHVDTVNINVADEELIKIGKLGIKNKDGSRRGPLAFGLPHIKAIQKYFKNLGRLPTDIELESIAQTWSEHCKHTIFANPLDDIKDGLFNTYIKAATDKIRKKQGKKDFCVSVFTDNSGAIKFNDNYLITHKVETHNSPSALDPFGGAVTGIVGVNRDAIGFGMGAKPIINIYGFCFADPDDDSVLYKGPGFTQKMLSARRIMNGVIEGVNTGGNCSGIPTPQGFIFFDKRYRGKPLVFVGTVGLIPKKINGKKSHIKKAQPGDYIVMVGGRVGLDGIHGATFSSEVLDSGSPATAVQIGDPITQKKMSDALIKEARDLGLYHSITDNGAGGLSCSVAEMAKESGGCLVQLDKVPLKYPGLSPWQIWISESQERMTLAVAKNKWKKLSDLLKRRGVEATIIGTFTKSNKCVVKYLRQNIMDIKMNFLHNGLPISSAITNCVSVKLEEQRFLQPNNLTKILQQMLRRKNICSFEYISMQYDHEVQGTSVLKPLQGRGRVNAEATVTRPLLSSNKGVIISQGINPLYGDIDTYQMAACAIDTAVRNAIVSGADINHLALLDNFCWCSSTEPERLAQLKQAVKACYDIATIYNTPFISGKDSMFNDFKGYDEKGNPIKISIPPTLLISTIGIVDDVLKTISPDLKFPGDLVYVLGVTLEEMGASEYYSMNGVIGNNVAHVDARKNKKLYKDYYKCVTNDLISSAISICRGGLGVALAKTAIGGMLGCEINLYSVPKKTTRDDFILFSESQGRIIVSINPQNKKEFEKIMQGNVLAQIGIVSDNTTFTIRGNNKKIIINSEINTLLESYKSTFKDY